METWNSKLETWFGSNAVETTPEHVLVHHKVGPQCLNDLVDLAMSDNLQIVVLYDSRSSVSTTS